MVFFTAISSSEIRIVISSAALWSAVDSGVSFRVMSSANTGCIIWECSEAIQPILTYRTCYMEALQEFVEVIQATESVTLYTAKNARINMVLNLS